MKTTAVLGLLALVPSALGLGTCHAGQRYCGSWLIDKDGTCGCSDSGGRAFL